MATPVPQFRIRMRMSGRATDEASRTSSPLEALFDLTFVVAVAQVADQLAGSIERGQALQGVLPFIMIFFAIWWAWLNFTWFASAYDTDDVPYRLLTLLQMGGALVLAAGVPAAFEHHNFFGITLGYFIMRVGLVSQWVRAAVENPDGRATALRYAAGVVLIQLGWIARLLLPTDAADVWWTVDVAFVTLVVLEFVNPYWAERSGLTTWHPHHIAERYGLFAIILLGETIAVLAAGVGAIVTSGDSVGPLILVGVSALVLIFGLWWLYFLQPTGNGLEANRGGAWYWGYMHLAIFAALGALGGALEVAIRFAGGHETVAPETAAYAVAIPVAVYLLALVVAHVRILPGIIIQLWIVVPASLVILLIPLIAQTAGLPSVLAVISVVVALSVAATMIVGRRVAAAAQGAMQ
jgi:low temperature requirement protein LtrA